MAALMKIGNASVLESDLRRREFYRLVGDLHEGDFEAACGELIQTDEWFPTVARIREVSNRNRDYRLRVEQATAPPMDLVCPTCHGSHWVRKGGYEPPLMKAGDEGSRVQPCPNCTTNGKYSPEKERFYIQHQGGVPNPNATKDIETLNRTFRVPRLSNGRIDMEALYQESRRLRGMPPGDDRPRPVGSWQTIGSVLTSRELVVAGVDDEVF